MQINNLNLPLKSFSEGDSTQLKPGQRLMVEIISNQNQEGWVSLNGRIVKAKIEAQVAAGDKLWTSVKTVDREGIVLSREGLAPDLIGKLSPEEVITLLTRGFQVEPNISEYLSKFIHMNSTLLSLLADKTNEFGGFLLLLQKIIPHWPLQARPGGPNGPANNFLLTFFKSLGLEYEKSIYDSYKLNNSKNTLDHPTVKMELLKLLANDGLLPDGTRLSNEQKQSLGLFLQEITGQQLWVQTGINDNAYFLLHFPLQDGERYYYVKMALESPHRGDKIDVSRSHIALRVEMPHLGTIGVDLLRYDESLSVCILHDDVEGLRPLIEELKEQTESNFRLLGLNLQRITLESFEDNPQFEKFLSGKPLGGVDLKG